MLKRFALWVGGKQARVLTEVELELFRESLGGLAEASRNRYLGATSLLVKWACKRRYVRLSKDQVSDALKPYKEPRRLTRALRSSEIASLIQSCIEHDAEYPTKVTPFVLLCLLTGMRPGEGLALKWSDVDLERGEVRVWGSKTMVERSIPLHDSPALVLLLKSFPRTNERVLGAAKSLQRRVWERVRAKAKLPKLQKNELRKTCISAVASGSQYSEFLLEARFGHSKDVSVRHYRQAMHRASGSTVEEWLGVENVITSAISNMVRGRECNHLRLPSCTSLAPASTRELRVIATWANVHHECMLRGQRSLGFGNIHRGFV